MAAQSSPGRPEAATGEKGLSEACSKLWWAWEGQKLRRIGQRIEISNPNNEYFGRGLKHEANNFSVSFAVGFCVYLRSMLAHPCIERYRLPQIAVFSRQSYEQQNLT